MKERPLEEILEQLLLAIEIDQGVVYEILSHGEPAREYLLKLLQRDATASRPELSKRAALVAGAAQLKETVSLLEEWTRSSDASLAMSGLHALARSSVPSARSAAVAILKSSKSASTVKGHALMALEQLGGREELKEIEEWRLDNGVRELERVAETVAERLRRRLAPA